MLYNNVYYHFINLDAIFEDFVINVPVKCVLMFQYDVID